MDDTESPPGKRHLLRSCVCVGGGERGPGWSQSRNGSHTLKFFTSTLPPKLGAQEACTSDKSTGPTLHLPNSKRGCFCGGRRGWISEKKTFQRPENLVLPADGKPGLCMKCLWSIIFPCGLESCMNSVQPSPAPNYPSTTGQERKHRAESAVHP